MAKTRVLGLSISEDSVMLAWVTLTEYQCVTDKQTDRQTIQQLLVQSSAQCATRL